MTVERTYLDHNATAPLRPEARAAMLAALDVCGNPSSVHSEGRAARALIETARAEVAALFHAKPGEIIFTSGATEANAHVFAGRPWARVWTGNAEHVSVLDAARRVAAERTEAVCRADGTQDVSSAARWASSSPEGAALASLALANGETGVLQPVGDLIAAVKPSGVIVHTDAAQAAGRLAIDFGSLGADLMSVSAHKLGGPKGTGALLIRDGVAMEPLLAGGGQERRRRAGTENVAAIAGFGAAAAAARAELSQMARVAALRDGLEAELKRLTPDCVVIGADAARLPNTTLVAVPGKAAETLVIKFDLHGVAISAGAACSSGKVGTSHVLSAMGLGPDLARSAIRVSLGPTTTADDVKQFLAAWRAVMGQPALAA